MLVHGTIIPPRAVLDAVDAVVRGVSVPAGALPESVAKGLRGRFGRHRAEGAEPTADPPMLEHVPVERMNLPITGFGNLTAVDAHRVAATITEAASAWTAPTVRLAGGAALEFPGDWSVWAKLDGEVEALADIARRVTQCVERLGFYVDRRQFRPMLAVATVTPATTGPFLQEVVDALEAFRGEEWSADIALTKEMFVNGVTQTVELQRVALPR